MYKRTTHNKGFTLIEILVVLAISMILMGLVLYPVAQSFKMTRSAQAMVESQDAARHAMEQISRDLGEAMDVLDYTGRSIDIPVFDPSANPNYRYISVPDAKIDFVLPKMLVHCNNPSHSDGKPRDFSRGDEALPSCPECDLTNVEVRPKLPLEQDAKVVRYFLGLAYNDPGSSNFGWLSPWGNSVEADKGNQVVLYRVEFDPHDPSFISKKLPQQLLDRFDGDEVLANLCDPQFFYRTDTWQAWQTKARVIGVAKYQDLVDGVDSNGDKIWDALIPSVTFKYKAVDNDIFTGSYSTDKSFEYPDTAPTVCRSEFAYWLPGYGVTVYRYTYDSDGAPSKVVAYVLAADGVGPVINRVEYTEANGTWSAGEPSTTFLIYQYLNEDGVPADPDSSGNFAEMGFTIDAVRGQVNFSLTPRKGPNEDSLSTSDLDPAAINAAFHNAYTGESGSPGNRMARRYDILSTFVEGSNNYLRNATIVPGSERVVGPNMTQGSDGSYVAYERVPFAIGEPGLNQYRINYKTGEIFFSPVYDQDLPEGHGLIRVDYKVHFNREDDVVRGNYGTKAAVVIHLGMRMYDPESSKPHAVDLSNTVKVRNALR